MDQTQKQGEVPEDTNIDGKGSLSDLSKGLDLLSQYTLAQTKEALETLHVYTRNLIEYPEEKKYQKVKLSNIHFQERLGCLIGATESMNAIGYRVQGDYLRLAQPKLLVARNSELIELRGLIQERHEQVCKDFASLPVRQADNHKYQSVEGSGAACDQGKRPNMEDDELVVDGFCGVPTQGYFALYDGHGGRGTVDFVVKTLHLNLEHLLKVTPEMPLAEAYEKAYLATDGQLRRQNILRSGTTAVTCLIRHKDGQRLLHTANVGDSRAILCRNNQAIRLTIDHKATLPEEAKRVKAAGGFVGRNQRVNGILAISRALGDHMLKENDVVTASPYCNTMELSEDDTFLILACDGVWDVMTDQEAVDLLLAKYETDTDQAKANGTPLDINQEMRDISRALVQESLDRHTQDNVSVICVKL